MNKEKKEKKEKDENHGWTNEHEMVLAEWGDKAMCYKWLHAKSNAKYRQLNTWYTIPVIIMSTLTGTANFAQDKIPESFRGYATMIIGGVNILAGIITTIQQFLKITELNEGHRVSSIVWDKFYRKIKVELSKHRDERTEVKDFFKSATEEYDRLMETSPVIDKNIIELFNKTFVKQTNINPLIDNGSKKEVNAEYTPDLETSINTKIKEFIVQENGDNNEIYNLFNNVGDQMTFEQNNRQFYTNPSTTIPNKQDDFLSFCFETLPSEKPLTIY